MANLQDLYNAILNGKLEQAVAVTQEAINEGISPTEIINQYMVKALVPVLRQARLLSRICCWQPVR